MRAQASGRYGASTRFKSEFVAGPMSFNGVASVKYGGTVASPGGNKIDAIVCQIRPRTVQLGLCAFKTKITSAKSACTTVRVLQTATFAHRCLVSSKGRW